MPNFSRNIPFYFFQVYVICAATVCAFSIGFDVVITLRLPVPVIFASATSGGGDRCDVS
jgi:hypothetical protein